MFNFKGNFKKQLAQYQKQVNAVLADFFNEKAAETPFCNSRELVDILANLRDFLLCGGKRLRGFLIIVGYELFGGKNMREILKFSAAFEMIHAALLIHDDIVDQDELRRGALTLHKRFEKKVKSEKIGKQIAIQAANFMSNFAVTEMYNTEFPIKQKIAATNYMRKKIFITGLGEMLDIHFSGEKNISKKDILKIYALKTTSYTIEAPFFCGALLAGAEEKNLAPFQKFILQLGQIFQTKDDFLGIFGNKKITGKSITSDLKEGKMNMVLKGIETSLLTKQRKKFFQYFGEKDISEKQFFEIKKIISGKNVRGKIETEIYDSMKQLKQLIKKLPISTLRQKFFKELASYIIERKK